MRGAAGRSTTIVHGDWSRQVTIPSAGSVTVTPPAQYAVFQLINRQSGRAMDIPNASTAAGTGVVQYTPGSAANQRFRFTPVGSGVYEIHITHGGTPLALGVTGGSTSNSATIEQQTANGGTGQQWRRVGK
uniref:RICIN domain-containing protein n=1 Tax=Streptomyces sp. NBC_00008 TaxID=2903610 RepID=A0AAU2W250_9ACTN